MLRRRVERTPLAHQRVERRAVCSAGPPCVVTYPGSYGGRLVGEEADRQPFVGVARCGMRFKLRAQLVGVLIVEGAQNLTLVGEASPGVDRASRLFARPPAFQWCCSWQLDTNGQRFWPTTDPAWLRRLRPERRSTGSLSCALIAWRSLVPPICPSSHSRSPTCAASPSAVEWVGRTASGNAGRRAGYNAAIGAVERVVIPRAVAERSLAAADSSLRCGSAARDASTGGIGGEALRARERPVFVVETPTGRDLATDTHD